MTKINDKEIENRLLVSKLLIRKRFKWLSVLVSKTRFLICDECDTAYTDGKNVYFSSEFVSKITQEELNFLALHEVLHIFLLHVKRTNFMGFQFEHEIHNEACDYVINLMIKQMKSEDFVLIKNCLIDEKYEEMSTEEVYYELAKKPRLKKRNSKIKVFATPHDKWGKLTSRELSSIKSSIAEGIMKAGEGFGKGVGYLRDLLKELQLSSRRDWKELLRNFFFTTKSTKIGSEIKYEDRLLGNDIYFLEDILEDAPENLLIACDISGSINNEVLKKFLSEILSCVKEFDLHQNDNSKILFFHSFIEGVFDLNQLNSGDDIETLLDYVSSLKSGGTDFNLAYEYFEEKGEFNGLIMLTDCEGEFPQFFNEPNLIITDNTRAKNVPDYADIAYIA